MFSFCIADNESESRYSNGTIQSIIGKKKKAGQTEIIYLDIFYRFYFMSLSMYYQV